MDQEFPAGSKTSCLHGHFEWHPSVLGPILFALFINDLPNVATTGN